MSEYKKKGGFMSFADYAKSVGTSTAPACTGPSHARSTPVDQLQSILDDEMGKLQAAIDGYNNATTSAQQLTFGDQIQSSHRIIGKVRRGINSIREMEIDTKLQKCNQLTQREKVDWLKNIKSDGKRIVTPKKARKLAAGAMKAMRSTKMTSDVLDGAIEMVGADGDSDSEDGSGYDGSNLNDILAVYGMKPPLADALLFPSVPSTEPVHRVESAHRHMI